MQISSWAYHLVERSLAESMDVHSMVHLARRLIHNYDIYEKSGFPKIIAIPNRDAAKQIVNDMRKRGLFLDFVKLLIDARETGIMGRKYKIPYISGIINEIKMAGYMYDPEINMFVEDPQIRRTMNWGILKEGEEYIFTFLKFDMVKSSMLVRELSSDFIEKIYADVRKIVFGICESRNGRVWLWEGDGGLISFYLGDKENIAAMSAIEILHELFIYNLLKSDCEKRIRVRMAIHSGPWVFTFDNENIKGDTIDRTIELEEKYTEPDTITFSDTVYRMLNQKIIDTLERCNKQTKSPLYKLYRYRFLKEF